MTGLDPAGPKFTNAEKDFRLDESDASYVDVIHTNAGFLGTSQRVGDIDFYPNGGKHQPGCLVNGRLKKGIFKILHELSSRCSNYLSFYFKATLKMALSCHANQSRLFHKKGFALAFSWIARGY